MLTFDMLSWERELRESPMQENYVGEFEISDIFWYWWDWARVFASEMCFDGPWGI